MLCQEVLSKHSAIGRQGRQVRNPEDTEFQQQAPESFVLSCVQRVHVVAEIKPYER